MVDVFSSMMLDVVPITIILLLISASIYALAYMLSKFLNNDQLRKWTETEIHQSFATACLLFFSAAIFGLFINLSGFFIMELINLQGLGDLYSSMTNPALGSNDAVFDENLQTEGEELLASDSHMKYARVFLLNQLNRLNSFYDNMFWTFWALGSSSSKFFPELGEVMGISMAQSTLKDSIFGYLFYGFLFTYMQLALLDLIKVFFFFMFPVGVFFRAFPLTNSLGSAMIAMSVGIYFIYPTVLSLLLITNYENLDLDEQDIISMVKSEEPSEFLDFYIKTKINYEEINQPLSKTSFAKTITNSADLVINFVNRILLNMFLFPMVAFTLTYSFIHAFAGFMQANVSELGRGLIRLI